MAPKRKTYAGGSSSSDPDAQRRGEANGTIGRFDEHGCWSSYAPSGWNDESRFMDMLVATRRKRVPDDPRSRDYSPAHFAEFIRASKFSRMFHPATLDAWDLLAEWRFWQAAPAGGAAEDAVKHAGFGPFFRWTDGGGIVCTRPDLWPKPLPTEHGEGSF